MTFQVFQSLDGSYMTIEGDMDGIQGIGTEIKPAAYLTMLGLPADATPHDVQMQFNQAQNLRIEANAEKREADANAAAAIKAAEDDHHHDDDDDDDVIIIDDGGVVVPDPDPEEPHDNRDGLKTTGKSKKTS